MPELPLVEKWKSQVSARCLNKRVVFTVVNITNRFSEVASTESIFDKILTSVSRKGKVLILEFENSVQLRVHFMLTGFLEEDYSTASRIVLTFDDDTVISFSDKRGFMMAACCYASSPNLLHEVGPDALNDDFTISYNSYPIKEYLTNQHFIAGIGNIYADEICFKMGVLPTRSMESVDYNKLKQVIKDEITNAVEWEKNGTVEENLYVYNRQCEKCKVCGSELKRIKFNERNTHFCPVCQT